MSNFLLFLIVASIIYLLGPGFWGYVIVIGAFVLIQIFTDSMKQNRPSLNKSKGDEKKQKEESRRLQEAQEAHEAEEKRSMRQLFKQFNSGCPHGVPDGRVVGVLHHPGGMDRNFLPYSSSLQIERGDWTWFSGKCKKCQEEWDNLERLWEEAKQLKKYEIKRLYYLRFFLLEKLLSISPIEFRVAFLELLKELGFFVEHVHLSPHDHNEVVKKDGKTYRIECKQYDKAHPVSRRDIQFFDSDLFYSHADIGLFVTTSHFADAASEYAKGKRIELIDGKKLMDYVKQAYPDELAGQYRTMCFKCGEVVYKTFGSSEASATCKNGHEVPDIISPSDLEHYESGFG